MILRRCPSGDHIRCNGLWVDRTTLNISGKPVMIEAGHAPASYESATANT
jgi:hypothetical protein